ncbi:hypothetical protein B0H11DRAFT_1743512, partial [Mycena galericulata]
MSTPNESSHRGRKTAGFLTNHFSRLEKTENRSGRYKWKCNYCGDNPNSCGASIEGRDNALPQHLADSRKCPNAPSTARAAALRFIAEKKKTSESTEDTQSARDTDNTIIIVDDAAETQPNPKKRKAIQGTLSGFVDHAMTETQKNSADRKLLRYIVHANVAFRSVENPFLQEFLHDLRPTYEAPGRYAL